MARPTIFVGSSTEGLEIARAVQDQLVHDCEITLWSDTIFDLGRATLESLVELSQRFAFAVLALTSDDIATVRGTTMPVPRDNVVFELGLFMGRLGRERTFAVCERTLPMWNDLAGITVALFERTRSDENLTAALGPACNQIRRAIKRLGPRQPKERLAEFWRPFLGGDSLIIIGHFDVPHFEGSGLIGLGDAMALIEIQTYCGRLGLPHPPVHDSHRLGPAELGKNLILIGGPDVNRLTEKILSRIGCMLKSNINAVEDPLTNVTTVRRATARYYLGTLVSLLRLRVLSTQNGACFCSSDVLAMVPGLRRDTSRQVVS